MPLPPLPTRNIPYSSNIHIVAQILHSHYETINTIFSSRDYNKHCLQHHAHLIFNDTLPLLFVLEEEIQTEKVLMNWLQDVAQKFLGLTIHILNVKAEASDEKYKLILWEIIIHGIVNGYSRRVNFPLSQ